MFDVTPDDIARLGDAHLRELVGRLCEAELASRGLSTAAVTWSGAQTAADGGLDVRVSLPAGTPIHGYVPRCSTGFQVKIPDMPRSAIGLEMRPHGTIRPVIEELAAEGGAYVIVSSHGSVADSALRDRRAAMREALLGVADAARLEVDFFDRTRLASWVRRHPGPTIWVKEKVGRALVGWRPYGPWSGPAEGPEAEYLLDDKLRLRFRGQGDAPAMPIASAIDDLRDELAKPRASVRLVGLSGVGKTRLVQALFDARVGSRPLAPALAVYTNLSDNPDPQPIGLASDLLATRTRAILIVDNCPPDLHRSLSELCARADGTISVLTVEYDVREDQPEGTRVVALDTASPELIGHLIRRRFPHLSDVDAHTIADVSGGNARIAIALAGTVERTESIAGLSDEDLFQRLFRQRHETNDSLLRAAEACALVYSFHGEDFDGAEAELPRLAELANQSPRDLYRHVGELLRRDLVQRRSVWRAVLPHAVANRLAARALADIPYDIVDRQLVTGGTDRLARSFSRRLGFLHDDPSAVSIVTRWLAPGGLLGDVAALDELGCAMFENVAPVRPEATLAALERAEDAGREAAATIWRRHRALLRSLAYDPALFERSTALLARAVTEGGTEREIKETSEVFASLFTIHLSGTHATIDQRLAVVERLLRSSDPKRQSLGSIAFDAFLETVHFGAMLPYDFGARSRDYGSQPACRQDEVDWFEAAFGLVERLAIADGVLRRELGDLLSQRFRGLWTSARMFEQLESLCRKFSEGGFWRPGWAACRQTAYFDSERMGKPVLSRLRALEADLGPVGLSGRVRAFVLGGERGASEWELMDADDDFGVAFEKLEISAIEFGAAVAIDQEALDDLLPDLVRGGTRTFAFGRGLARAATDPEGTWKTIVAALALAPPGQHDVQVLRGFLVELWERDNALAQALLDECLDDSVLIVFIPPLQSAVPYDRSGVDRLKRGLRSGQVPVAMFRQLAFGRATDQFTAADLRDLVMLVAEQPNGDDVALEILSMRLHGDRSSARLHEPEIVDAGRALLEGARFKKDDHRGDHNLARIAMVCLAGSGGASLAGDLVRRLDRALSAYEISSHDYGELWKALLATQSTAALTAILDGSTRLARVGLRVFDTVGDHRSTATDVIPCHELVAWCDGDAERRYPLAASFISFAGRAEEGEPLTWSEQAKALLRGAPDPGRVLTAFVERFRPTIWMGSRASWIEANARLLDDLEPPVAASLAPIVADARARLARAVAEERTWESDKGRSRDERFE